MPQRFYIERLRIKTWLHGWEDWGSGGNRPIASLQPKYLPSLCRDIRLSSKSASDVLHQIEFRLEGSHSLQGGLETVTGFGYQVTARGR